jgi:hypothetical protein
MLSAIETFIAHLRSQNPDSLDWADGCGHETSRELMQQFSATDWDELSRTWREQRKEWRTCLTDVLDPRNPAASSLLLDMTSDQDTDVSFSALRGVAFYCGVNASSDGPFLDERIRDPVFLAAAQNHPSLMIQLERVGDQCSNHFRQQFKLLASVLSRARA